MDFEEFYRMAKEISENNPAKLSAEVHGEKIKTEVKGSGLDLLTLSMYLACEIMERINFDIDDYCKCLRMGQIQFKFAQKFGQDSARYIIRDLFGKGDKKDE